MSIVLIIIFSVIILIITGKIKGPPSPSKMSDEAIINRLGSENDWIARYNNLSHENKNNEGIKKQFESKQLYMTELMLEMNNRHGKKEESLAPVMQRALELIRQGIPETVAQQQAIAEYVSKRDAARNTPIEQGGTTTGSD